ncbi:MAG TPA: sigma-70 family RNA polymerase sigma factor [Polyangiales bacterium]|nr:sigma-70 family RNA polymerase sigma factor [Polyangiales bacterium]
MSDDEQREWIQGALTRYEQPLLRFAAQWVGAAHARDVVQDTFLALCKAQRNEIEHRLAPWLFVVCRNRAIDFRRAGGRLSALDDEASLASDDAELAGDAAEQQHSLGRVQQIVAQLPAKQRQALLLKFSAGMSYKQIAEVMELTVSHVGVLLHNAIKHVRERLGDEAIAEPGGEP